MRDQEPPDWALPSWDAVPPDPLARFDEDRWQGQLQAFGGDACRGIHLGEVTVAGFGRRGQKLVAPFASPQSRSRFEGEGDRARARQGAADFPFADECVRGTIAHTFLRQPVAVGDVPAEVEIDADHCLAV